MPRASLLDVSKGGAGFQEGRILVVEAYSTMFQYPVNATTGIQSDAFVALVLKGVRLDDKGAVVHNHDGEPEEVEIPIRMASVQEDGRFSFHPGSLAVKDFDNMDADPEDLGVDMDAKGNTFYATETGNKFGAGWGYIEESLRKQGFKPEILGRSIMTDFVGLDAHFKQEAGKPYVAKKGKDKGKEVTPTNLVCSRIFPPYPYDLKPAELQKRLGGKAASGSTAAASGKANGATSTGDVMEAAKVLFAGGTHPQINQGKPVEGLSAEFKKAVKPGAEVKLEVFRKAMVNEFMRKKVNPVLQKRLKEEVIGKDEQLAELAMELVDMEGAFSTDGETITFN